MIRPARRSGSIGVPNAAALAVAACLLGAAGGCRGMMPAGGAVRGVAQGASAPAPVAGSTGWVRAVAPFPVFDSAGGPVDHPFLGGFVAPRPQLVDLDGDGDLDLFIQERAGELIHFENTGDPRTPRFVWRTDRFRGLETGEWARFVDLDGDGRLDLAAEEPFSHIRLFRNTGPLAEPSFSLLPDSLRDAAGRAIFADRQNTPAFFDLDCDGSLDLFLGRVEGTLARYEAAGEERGGLPRFALLTERFEEIEIVGQMQSDGSRHGANGMAWGDVDGDGPPDLLWGDYFEPGLLLIPNRGSCAAPSLRSTPRPLESDGSPLETSGFNAPFLGDLDGDGDLDLLVGVLGGAFNPIRTATENLHLHENLGGGRFTERTRRLIGQIDAGSESVPTLGDLDGDGDLDLLIGNKIDPVLPDRSTIEWWENTGSPSAPSFRLRERIDHTPFYHAAPAVASLWAGEPPALVVGSWNRGILVFRNRGSGDSPRWEEDPSLGIRLQQGGNGIPTLGDLDGDGDLDLLVGRSNGEISHYRNEGTPESPAFSWVTDRFADLDVGRRAAPALIDLNGDGLPDLAVGSEAGGLRLFRNVGTAGAPHFEEDLSPPPSLPPYSTPGFGDLDGDGRPELLSGTASGGVVFFWNRNAP